MRHSIAAVLAMAAAALPCRADEAVASQRRNDLERERTAIESRYQADERRCASRFAVTACVDDAKARRRDAMKPLERELDALDASERRQRASERLRRIEEKRREVARRQATDMQAAPETSAAPKAGPALRSGRASPPRVQTPPAQAKPGSSAAYERRQREAEMHRAHVQRRNEERARRRPPAASLPARPEGMAP